MIGKSIVAIDTSFKDDSPQNTIQRIKGILDQHGIETSEQWFESGVPNCFSLRVTVRGTDFGSNGKGVTKELALASAYGELIERLQIGRIFKSDQQKNGGLYINGKNDEYVSAEELLDRNKEWYARYAQTANNLTGANIAAGDILKQYTEEDGTVATTAFYCVNKQTRECLPTKLLNSVYTANGCAAGNSLEEALVQAISEIVERQFSTRILMEHIELPEISDEALKNYKIAYESIEFLRSHDLKVVVKDGSLGTNFPVVCVCLIDQKTGKYHTHFGAFPNFEIALERTLTESFQGLNIEKVAKWDSFYLNKNDSFDLGNLMNQLVKGTSDKSPEFFIRGDKKHSAPCGFAGTNNRELLKECIAFISDQGYDVLIRDCSCLGFPTYQVIVPGYSEVFAYRMVPQYNDLRFCQYSQKVVLNPSVASVEELMGFLMDNVQMEKRQLGTTPFSQQANLPVRLSAGEERYLMNATMASVNYTLRRYTETVSYINRMLSEGFHEGTELLICIKRYLTLSAAQYDKETIRTILGYFHQKETVQYLFDVISEKGNLLDRFTLHCDKQCLDSCIMHDVCMKKCTDVLAETIDARLQKMDNAELRRSLEKLLK